MQNNITVSEIGEVGTLIISEETQKTIDYLHNNIRGKEWAGLLIYKLKSGKLATLKNIILETIDIYPTCIGTVSHFEISPGKTELDIYNDIPESLESLIGIVHSHHDMGAFFSEEDYREYTGNAAGFYLSLVVDCRNTHKARIVIPLSISDKFKGKIREPNGQLNTINVNVKLKQYLVGDLKIEIKGTKKDWLVKRYEYIRNKANKPIWGNTTNIGIFGNTGTVGTRETFITNPNTSKNLYPTTKKTKKFEDINEDFSYTLTFLSKHLGIHKANISEITLEELESLKDLRVDTTIDNFLKNNGHLMLEGSYLSEMTVDEYIGAMLDELYNLQTDELLLLETWLETINDYI